MKNIWVLTETEHIEYSNHPKIEILGRWIDKPTFEMVKEKVAWCNPVIGAILRNDKETISKYIGPNLEYDLTECLLSYAKTII